MSNLTKEDMQDVMREVLLERNAVGGEQHHNDHEFIQLLKEREERRVARIEKFKLSMIGTMATAITGAMIWLGTVIWEHVFKHT